MLFYIVHAIRTVISHRGDLSINSLCANPNYILFVFIVSFKNKMHHFNLYDVIRPLLGLFIVILMVVSIICEISRKSSTHQ